MARIYDLVEVCFYTFYDGNGKRLVVADSYEAALRQMKVDVGAILTTMEWRAEWSDDPEEGSFFAFEEISAITRLTACSGLDEPNPEALKSWEPLRKLGQSCDSVWLVQVDKKSRLLTGASFRKVVVPELGPDAFDVEEWEWLGEPESVGETVCVPLI